MLLCKLSLYTALLSLTATAVSKQLSCSANVIPVPTYFGTKVLNIDAEEIHDYEVWGVADFLNIPYERKPISFCNVTITYTHPGLNDNVNVYIWLPLENWNERYIGMGGGGYSAGMRKRSTEVYQAVERRDADD